MQPKSGVLPFNASGRATALAQMAGQELDLLVIGGGITGAGVARAAAMGGLSLGLVEKADFASGTSGRSSKLIHSGVRYLLVGDVAMVRESGRERAVLRAIAPHLVRPLPFVLPIYAGESRWLRQVFFTAFDWLAGTATADAHRLISAAEVRQRAPYLREPLAGGIQYGEYLVDDARLTLETAMSAARCGARVANYAQAENLIWTPAEPGAGAGAGGTGGGGQRRVVGAVVADVLSGRRYHVRSRVVVNATGPRTGATLADFGLAPPKPVRPSKGIHLLFAATRLPVSGALVLRSPSGRQGFAIRRDDWVYVGTSDEPYDGDLDVPTADCGEVTDLLRLAQECFPDLDLRPADIAATWAGLRPLIAQPGKSSRDTSRHDAIWAGPPGLITVAGGKLTTFRAMARRVLQRVCQELGRHPGADRTASAPLPRAGCFAEFRPAAIRALQDRAVPPAAAARLLWLYGTGVADLLVMGAGDPQWLQPLAPGCLAVRGEVRLAVEQEMAVTLADFMDRRSGLLLFTPDHGRAAAPAAAGIMGALLGWNAAAQARQLAHFQNLR